MFNCSVLNRFDNSKRFFSGYFGFTLFLKTNTFKFKFNLKRTDTFRECSVGKQMTIFFFDNWRLHNISTVRVVNVFLLVTNREFRMQRQEKTNTFNVTSDEY